MSVAATVPTRAESSIAESRAQQAERNVLAADLERNCLGRGSGGVLRQSAFDPVTLFDGPYELIGYTVELIQIVRDQMQVKGWVSSAARLVTDVEALVNAHPALSNSPWPPGSQLRFSGEHQQCLRP